MSGILDAALALHKAGISVVPVMADGSKRPAGKWKQFTTSRATPDEIRAWFGPGSTHGLGVVTGAISGNLEMVEIEGRAAHQITGLRDRAHAAGNLELWNKLSAGWLEQSPSGGFHWFYRTKDPVPGNTKIAKDTDRVVLAETRGEGGFVVTAPSAGTVHSNGKAWVLLRGGPATAPTLSADEREDFHALLASIGAPEPEAPQQQSFQDTTPAPRGEGDPLTPGDDFEKRTEWDQILTGWTRLYTAADGTTIWRRPGKTTGQSGSTGHAQDRDRFWAFTSSTAFAQETPYTKFGAFAALNFGGDHAAAAAELRKRGFGAPLPLERAMTLTPFTPANPTIPADSSRLGAPTLQTEGATALATVHQLPVHVTESLTDYGNSRMLIKLHGKHLRYAPSRGAWLQWDGGRWATQEDDGPAVQAMWETVLALNPAKDEEAKHQQRSLSRRSLESSVALARRDPDIRVTANELDAHPFELNTPNGIINLRTGEFSPPDPEKLHTKVTGVRYDPDATCPKWEKFLLTTFDGDQDMAAYLQRLAGYSATGQVGEHVLPFLHGDGGNGKGQFIEVLLAIFGDYGTTAPANFLMSGRDRHETEIARLAGMRLLVCSEINPDARFDEAKVKLLTGGDKLTARFMNQNHFSFIPAHTIWLMGNHKPTIAAGGDSFFRRLRLLGFTHKVPESAKIVGLSNMLLDEEGPGILNWLIAGAVDVLRDGMREPASVMAATSLYMEEEDAFARFVTDRCTLGPATAMRIDTAHMRREYSTWCREQGEQEVSPQQFGRDLKSRYNIEQARSHGKRYYTGITIFANPPEAPEHWSNQ